MKHTKKIKTNINFATKIYQNVENSKWFLLLQIKKKDNNRTLEARKVVL